MGDDGWQPGLPSGWPLPGTVDVGAVAGLLGGGEVAPLVQAVTALSSNTVNATTADGPRTGQLSGNACLADKRQQVQRLRGSALSTSRNGRQGDPGGSPNRGLLSQRQPRTELPQGSHQARGGPAEIRQCLLSFDQKVVTLAPG